MKMKWILALVCALLPICVTASAVAVDKDDALARESMAEIEAACSKAELNKAGQYAAANRRQCEWALAPIRKNAAQKGNTCTCEALLNVAFEMKIEGTTDDNALAELSKKIKCNDGNFEVFANFAQSPVPGLKGHVYGGYTGLFANKHLEMDANPIETLMSAVSEDRIGVVGLNVKPIYVDYATTHHLSWPDSFEDRYNPRLSHALTVRAVLRASNGKVENVIVVDSSGPARLYMVPYEVFAAAYASIPTMLSRGVYITAAKRVPNSSDKPK